MFSWGARVAVFLGGILKKWATAGYFVTWRLRMRITKIYFMRDAKFRRGGGLEGGGVRH
jgi:hypothetical protein